MGEPSTGSVFGEGILSPDPATRGQEAGTGKGLFEPHLDQPVAGPDIHPVDPGRRHLGCDRGLGVPSQLRETKTLFLGSEHGADLAGAHSLGRERERAVLPHLPRGA